MLLILGISNKICKTIILKTLEFMVRRLFWKTVVINDRRLFHLVSNQTDKKICTHNNYHRQGKRVLHTFGLIESSSITSK